MDSVFEELYEKYHDDIFNFLFYMVRNREQTEDLVQEVYIKVLRSYKRFKGESSEKTWLLSIARHVAIDFFRKQKSRQQKLGKLDWSEEQLGDGQPLPEEIAIQKEEIQLMYRCLERCTIDQQLVIVLRFIQSLSITETAEALGWTESKVKTTQHRALKVLKKYMEEEMEKGRGQREKVSVE
ncbi:RNA polymerase sigma factor SigX [Parageobacillus sp. VR-IP]|uniref:RNA polymerase sigma factor n=1 Tax=Parageobacillus caldoxylosilyticus NBRC 107762 TaxID=1220594 RepID=A0A023DID7_9BACL|nr:MULTISPECIES: RNA polymerase sigma factor SigX [Parageobacillus]OQP01804.1 RNA polymerase sigma factor SigX [Geobacillus sp. 44B]MBB3853766.1 RNA polymerase sigma-70 factor (ECF subfamily) [Parageobacillus caldoxylosilyticus]NUK31213.1 RNA polymerase sigma factor SigX [Parageobacillus sp. VR-IP]QNU36602.1 RNA polymerase sigma factor SigX [Geobacillus sp. 44B]QXJ39788.1 RNA polymerase sigma factor SigX [Parageobacillus caldoxylosilyticus]